LHVAREQTEGEEVKETDEETTKKKT